MTWVFRLAIAGSRVTLHFEDRLLLKPIPRLRENSVKITVCRDMSFINPYMTNVLSYCYHLGESTSVSTFKGVRSYSLRWDAAFVRYVP